MNYSSFDWARGSAVGSVGKSGGGGGGGGVGGGHNSFSTILSDPLTALI